MPGFGKFLACLGFGTEQEEGICHLNVLQRISELIVRDAFLGACALCRNSDGFALYKEACEFAWRTGRKSHIHTKVISAVEGVFGVENMYGKPDAGLVAESGQESFISPLMSFYWFFDLSAVASSYPLADALRRTRSGTDVLATWRQKVDEVQGHLLPCRPIPY